MSDLARLLEPARRALADESLHERSVRLARARTLSGAAPRRRSKLVLAPARTLLFAASIAAFLLVSTLLVRTWSRASGEQTAAVATAVTFTMAGAPGVVGERVVATAPRTFDFDDGARVELAPHGALRVLALDDRGGRLLVEQGTIHAAFHHRDQTRWTVEAGGMLVEVTGTRFDVTFDPTTQAFELVMHEGSVRVRGCGVDAGRVVQGTESLRVSCAAEPPASAAIPALTPADLPSAPVAPASASPSAGDPASATVAGTGTDGSRELLAQADAARRGGDVTAARTTLLDLRRRFPRGAAAPEAAFDLGVLAFDVAGNYADAERWFHRYLEEAPRGALAREALARVMEARSNRGDAAAAAEAADRYLASYPGGPHASLAKRLVAQRP